jgi:hypothetical protein
MRTRDCRLGNDTVCLRCAFRTGDATANGLFSMICTFEFISFLALMRDVLPVLARVSGMWQHVSVDLAAVEVTAPSLLYPFRVHLSV